MTRQSVSNDYDAVVDLVPAHEHVCSRAYVLVKRTYRITAAGLDTIEAEPLAHDFRGRGPDALALGSDFWIHKQRTDVVILGAAHAPAAHPVVHMEVRCDVGTRHKRVAVFGTRFIEWSRGRARIGSPTPFTRQPVDRIYAYGGVDTRVPLPPIHSLMDALDLSADHPGSYPRNPEGKGYYVVPDRFDGIELPNLEDPDDLLTDERLVVGTPERWYRQPLPWSFDWQPMHAFPRRTFFGLDARHPAPAAALTEVQRGYLPEQYASLSSPAATGDDDAERAFAKGAYQEASSGLEIPEPTAGTPVSVAGMHPERHRIDFVIPEAPRVEIALDGWREPLRPRLSTLLIRPDQERVTLTYCGHSGPLPRKLVPGLHRRETLSLRLDGGTTLHHASWPQPEMSDG